MQTDENEFMKLGTENKTKVVIAAVLLVLGVGLLLRTLFWSGAPTPAETRAAAPAATVAAKAKGPAGPRDPRVRFIAYRLQPTLDPMLRLDLLKDSEDLKYQGSGRNIFREGMEAIPKPMAPGLKGGTVAAKKDAGAPWRPPAQPAPPAITLKFYGWASRPGTEKAIFLSQGDAVYIAREGDIIARRYKIMKIGTTSVEVLDVLSNNTQSIPLQG